MLKHAQNVLGSTNETDQSSLQCLDSRQNILQRMDVVWVAFFFSGVIDIEVYVFNIIFFIYY